MIALKYGEEEVISIFLPTIANEINEKYESCLEYPGDPYKIQIMFSVVNYDGMKFSIQNYD